LTFAYPVHIHGCAHPNIFNFIDELLEVQSETQIKLRSTNQKKKSMLNKEQNPRKQMTKYTSNVVTRFELIKSILMKFLPSTYYMHNNNDKF